MGVCHATSSSSGTAGPGGGRGLFMASGQAWCFTGQRLRKAACV